MRFMTLRAVFLLGFVVAMPVLALPPVARRIDELLYGSPPTDVGKSASTATARPSKTKPAPATPQRSPESAVGLPGERNSPLGPQSDVSPANLQVQTPQLLATTASASMSPTPPFAPLQPPVSIGAAEIQPLAAGQTNIDEKTVARLHQIRQRLEALGADYVLVEARDQSGRYRFHCRMLVDERSRQTQPFESTGSDPVATGEQVLREVEIWRGSRTPSSGRDPG